MTPKPIALTEAKYIAEAYGYSHVKIIAFDEYEPDECIVQYSSDDAVIPWWLVGFGRLAVRVRRKAKTA